MELDLPGVACGEEIAADKQKHRNAQRQYEHRHNRHNEASREQHCQDLHIALAQSFEATFETSVQSSKPAGRARDIRRGVVFALEQQTDGDRRQSSRQAVRGKHGKNDGKTERREQVLGRPLEEHHGGEDATNGKRRDQSRYRNARGA